MHQGDDPADDAHPFSPDELAGVVDLFGALTPAELRQACHEVAVRRGVEHDPAAVDAAVDAAVEAWALVRVPGDPTSLLVGPAAFPVLPADGEDLPHIMDVPERDVDRASAAEAVETRFRTAAARAVEAGDADRMRALLDLSYDVDAWGPVDLAGARDRLDDALDDE